MPRPLYTDLDGHFRCFDFDSSRVVHEGAWEEWTVDQSKRRGRTNLIRTEHGRWLHGWEMEEPEPEPGKTPKVLYLPFREDPNRPAFRETLPKKAIARMKHLNIQPPPELLDDANASKPRRRRKTLKGSTGTIGALLKEFRPGTDDRASEWSKKRRAGFPGLDRLETIARNEWGRDLDYERFSLLRDHVGRILVQFHQLGKFGTDRVDSLTIDDAAEVLESACFDTDSDGEPTGRLENPSPTSCGLCGGPLTEADRAQADLWCHSCRVGQGTMMELDIAFKTGRGERYDQAAYDPLDVYPEWQEISTFICDRFNILRVNLDAWRRFSNWFMVAYKKKRGEYLRLKRTEVLELLRAGVPPATVPVQISTPSRQAEPPFSGTEALATSETKPLDHVSPPNPLVEKAPALPIVLGEPDDEPEVWGKVKKRLKPGPYRVVKALLEAHPERLSKDTLAIRGKVGDPIGMIKRLREDPDWAAALDMAGEPHGGYGIRLKRTEQEDA